LIVLDTNVLSEVGKQAPSARVMAWLDQWQDSDVYITTITEAEIRYGISLMSAGKRRTQLRQFAAGVLDAAKRYASIASSQKLAGMTVSVPDAQIAAIAASRGFSIATRNEKHFLHCGVTVVNPWIA
jgi:hypothetical protein